MNVKVALIVATILVMLVTLLFTKATDKTPEKKPSVMVDGVPLDEELELTAYRAWTPPIKAPHGTCIRWWNPSPNMRENDFGVQVRPTTGGIVWTSLSEFERKYPQWSWNEIRFAIADSNSRGLAVVKYKFVRQPCSEQKPTYAVAKEQAASKPVPWENLKSDGTVPVGAWGVIDIPSGCQMDHEYPTGFTVEVYNSKYQWQAVERGQRWEGTKIRFMATELNLRPPTYKMWCP